MSLNQHRDAGKLAEQAFRTFLKSVKAKQVVSRGWPDFLVRLKSGQVIAVEVKAHDAVSLKSDQLTVMQLLSELGVPCYRWSPDGRGLRPWSWQHDLLHVSARRGTQLSVGASVNVDVFSETPSLKQAETPPAPDIS